MWGLKKKFSFHLLINRVELAGENWILIYALWNSLKCENSKDNEAKLGIYDIFEQMSKCGEWGLRFHKWKWAN